MAAVVTAPDLLTVREAAERLRVSRTTVYELAASGELELVQIRGPRSGRITGRSLEDFIARLGSRARG